MKIIICLLILFQLIIYSNANSNWELVADVSGSTWANSAFWNQYCGRFGDITTSDTMRIIMGDVHDYYRPTQTMSFCHFLLNMEYSWSPFENGPFVIPRYYYDDSHYGGSESYWSRDYAPVELHDGREHISYWGSANNIHRGGCCSIKSTVISPNQF